MAKQKQQSININGKEYTEDQLTDTQKVLVNHVVDLDRKLQGLAFQAEQIQGGRNYFMAQLEASLKISEQPPKG